jgi:hypothetical protein
MMTAKAPRDNATVALTRDQARGFLVRRHRLAPS